MCVFTACGALDVLKKYQGSCHCGAVRFEAELNLDEGSYRCNCSICRRDRFWPAVATEDRFRLLSGAEKLKKYVPEKRQYFFCETCGVRLFDIGTDSANATSYGINLGCLEGITEEALSKIPITYVDGLNDRWDRRPEFYAHL